MNAYPPFRIRSLSILFPALAPAIGGAVTVQAGLVIAVVTLAAAALTGAVALWVTRRMLLVARLVCTVSIAITVASLAGFYLAAHHPLLRESIGVFLPLTAVNVLVIRQTFNYENDATADAYAVSLWPAALLIVVLSALGGIREILLSGTIMGTEILALDLSFFGQPAGLLIIVGTILAVGRALSGARSGEGQLVQLPSYRDTVVRRDPHG